MTEIIGGVLGAFGLSASAGLNAYIPLLVVSLLAKFTNLIELAEPWSTLESWWVIGVLAALSIIEFVADKVPAVDHINDVLQTFVRPVAGAIAHALDRPVGHTPQRSVGAPQLGHPQRQGLDGADGVAEVDLVTDPALVLQQHEEARDRVLHQRLSPEANRDPGDAGPSEERREVDVEGTKDE